MDIQKLIKNNNISFENVLKALKANAKKIHYKKSNPSTNNMFNIDSAVIFPFNKEMHSIVRFDHMINFNLKGIYDIRELSNIGKNTSELFSTEVKSDYVINDYNNLQWNDDFKTFILGHVREISNVKKITT